MRRTATALGLTAMLSLGVLGASAVSPLAVGAAAAKSPVKLSGTVNAEGTKDVSKKSDATLAMELDNFSFGPTFVKAKKGETITLELDNVSSAPHTFTSDALGVDEQVAPGQSASLELSVPSGGAFLFYCRFHQGAGMQGAVFTKAGAKVSTAPGSNAGTGTGTNSSSSTGSSGTGSSGGGSSSSTPSGGYGY